MTCRRVKAWLSQNGISYVERDVNVDPKAAEELKVRGLKHTPTTFFDDTAVMGFDEKRFEELLSMD